MAELGSKPSFASTSNWADDVEAEEQEFGRGKAPQRIHTAQFHLNHTPPLSSLKSITHSAHQSPPSSSHAQLPPASTQPLSLALLPPSPPPPLAPIPLPHPPSPPHLPSQTTPHSNASLVTSLLTSTRKPLLTFSEALPLQTSSSPAMLTRNDHEASLSSLTPKMT